MLDDNFITNTNDVAKEKLSTGYPIDLVGIKNLQIPIKIDNGMTIPTTSSIFVSLDDEKVRGIHMSRIYLSFHDFFKKNVLNLPNLKTILETTIKEQGDISSTGKIKTSFEYAIERPSLLSNYSGWRVYPVCLEVQKLPKTTEYIVEVIVTYSSTCPCSTSLSKDIIKNNFLKTFPNEVKNKEEVLKWLEENSLSATPHAQKSQAKIRLKINEEKAKNLSIIKIIDQAEEILGTAVQVSVKRQDEAEFAKRNAQNLMFCEDALRKLIHIFKPQKDILDYYIQVQHYESLHPFTVESSTVKGVENGWK